MTSNLENLQKGQNTAELRAMDRFEMLSAYLDGEVTAAERQQIQQWLQEDAKVQELYGRLLELRRQMQSISFPSTEESANKISEQVFWRLDQRKRQQKLLWGGGAIAALFIGVCSQILTGENSFLPQIANNNNNESEYLMVVVNEPVVPIPKGVTSYYGSYGNK